MASILKVGCRQAAAGLLAISVICISSAQESGSVRKWRAAVGNFEVEAALVDFTETLVRLKKSDGQIINVPLERLSDADRQFVAALLAAKPPLATKFSAPANPTIAPSGTMLSDKGPVVPWQPSEAPFGLAADPAIHTKPLPEGGFQATTSDAYDHVTAPRLLDPETNLVAFSIGRNVISRQADNRGRIFVGKLPKGPATVAWEASESLELWDYHAASDRALVMTGLNHLKQGGELLILEGLANGSPKELYRRKLPGSDNPKFADKVEWAVLLDAEHVAAVLKDQLRVWNLATAENIYAMALARSSRPALSPGKRYLGVPGKGGVALFNVVDAKPLGFISSGDALTPDVSFHPDGKRAAVTVSNRLIVYDLQAGQELTSATLPHPIGQQGWVGKDLLLTHLGSLIRTDLEMSVWQYSHSGRGTARAVPGGVLLATSGGSCNVASLNIPHKGLREASDQLERGGDAAMLVRPGSQVALAAELIDGVDRAQVLAALRTAVDRTGWKIAEKADIQVVAIIGRGMTEELQYRLPVPGVDRNSAPIQTANLTPFTARLEIRRSGQVLWSRNTTNYAPTIVFIKDGEELQNVIKNYERPNPEFFARLTIPPRIPKPELARGLGMSVPDGFAWKDLSAAPNGAKRAGK